MTNTISFDKRKFKLFKKAYAHARELKRGSFVFDDNEFLTDYAKYVIEYLEPKFKEVADV